MYKVFGVLLLLIASFAAGMVYERYGSTREGDLKQQISSLEIEVEELSARNEELKETLNLVKRQIQTDRVAYQALQEAVSDSERQRDDLKQQLESQRELLKQLKQQLTETGG